MKIAAKLLCVILAVMMLMSVMASCGGGDDKKDSSSSKNISTSSEDEDFDTDEDIDTDEDVDTDDSGNNNASGTYDTVEEFYNAYPDAYNTNVEALKKQNMDFYVEGNTMYYVLTSPSTLSDSQVDTMEEYYDENFVDTVKPSVSALKGFVSTDEVEVDITVKNPDGTTVLNKSYTVPIE